MVIYIIKEDAGFIQCDLCEHLLAIRRNHAVQLQVMKSGSAVSKISLFLHVSPGTVLLSQFVALHSSDSCNHSLCEQQLPIHLQCQQHEHVTRLAQVL